MIGTSIGLYRITDKLGAGGMGEVYRATDTKLKRDVALKVLPEAFARDPERLARFEREAEVLASLNHPNIAAIYGVVEDRALVMELVEGAEPKGPLPFDEAWAIMSQVVAALEYAHEKGVVHRDLKPANIKVTPDGLVKLLDFGLAKAFSNQSETAANPENSPTLTMGATQFGVILGTAAYMSPEQAKGKSADKRADIWAFGVVLYELITGERLFKGEDVSETLAQVLTKAPDLNKVPAKARKLLGRCLEKDPKKRLRDIADLVGLFDDEQIESTTGTSKLPWAVAGVLAAIAIAAIWIAWRGTRPVDHPLTRLSVDLGPDAVLGDNITVALSPDGRRIVFPVKNGLATRLLDQPQATMLAGTDNATDPFFSPDGQWIGFFANGKMKKISIQGGGVITLCDTSVDRGAAWGNNGRIIANLNGGAGIGLFQILAVGGNPEVLTKPIERGEATHRWPQILPGGESVLFTGHTKVGVGYEDASIEVLTLKTGRIKIVQRGGYFGQYLGSGHLVFIHEGTLFAVPFNLKSLEVEGTPVPMLDDLASKAGNGGGQFASSTNGTLVYLNGKSARGNRSVVWLDSSGKTQPLLAGPGSYNSIRFSPDGKQLAFSSGEIEVYDLARDTHTRLTFGAQGARYPVWTPDGKHIVFTALDKGNSSLQWIRSDGAGEPQLLLTSKGEQRPYSFSPDGKRLAFTQVSTETSFDIWTLPLDISDHEHPKPGKAEVFLRTPTSEQMPAFSPDGRWMAYTSDESGHPEVYVRPSPGPGGKWQISTAGGNYPIWSRNGRDLFYETLAPDNRIMVVGYRAKNDSFAAEKPHLWSDRQINGGTPFQNFDLAPDGKSFAVIPRPADAGEPNGSVHVIFLENFFDELHRRVPATK